MLVVMAALTGSDAELVARCRAGDDGGLERARRALLALRLRDLQRKASGSREHDAEDVFQDVFTRGYEHLDQLRTTTRSGPGSRS